MKGSKLEIIILMAKLFFLQGIILSVFTTASPIHNSTNNNTLKLNLENTTDIEEQTPAEDRYKILSPPTFPYWGPFGFTTSALLCPWLVGPFAGSWNRACAGPVPPFKRTTTTTTTTPAPNNSTTGSTDNNNTNDYYKKYIGSYYSNVQPDQNNNNYYSNYNGNNNNYPYGPPTYARRQQQPSKNNPLPPMRIAVSNTLPKLQGAAVVTTNTNEFLSDEDK